MDSNTKTQIVSFFKRGDVDAAVEGFEKAILDTVRGAAGAAMPAAAAEVASPVMADAAGAVEQVTDDAFKGETSSIVPDLEKAGLDALQDLEGSLTSAVSSTIPGILGQLVAPVVGQVLGVLEQKLTAATAPAIAAAQAKRIAARAGVSAQAAAAELAKA